MTRPIIALARRALRNTFRKPQFLAPIVIFPTLLLAVNVGGLSRTTDLPGFPGVAGFLDFQLAAAITQSLLLGGVGSGIAVALEIEGGFFDRMVAAPIPRAAIVLGRLASTAVVSLCAASYFLIVGLIFGAEVQSGIPGVVIVLLIAAVAGVGFGAIGVTIALLARSASTVQGIFPLVFVILFLSSAFFPLALLEPPASWLAEVNPLSYIADGMRQPIVSELDAVPILEGLAAAGAIAIVMAGAAVLALRGRLREA